MSPSNASHSSSVACSWDTNALSNNLADRFGGLGNSTFSLVIDMTGCVALGVVVYIVVGTGVS